MGAFIVLYFNIESIYVATIAAILEVFRRFIWNYLRLENEHLNNCGEFRATRDITIAPMEIDEQTLLCEMMDNTEVVTQKRTPSIGRPSMFLHSNGGTGLDPVATHTDDDVDDV